MKHALITRTALAAALFAATSVAMAASYFIVVPVVGKTVLLAGINVGLNSAPLPSGLVGLAYEPFDFNRVLSVTGDPEFSASRVSWSVSSGSLPAGLSLSREGRLSGTPTASGSNSFVLRAMYKTRTGEQTYHVAVTDLVIALADGALPVGVQGAPYSFDLKPRLTITGDGAYTGAGVTWRVTSGALPAGLALGADGVITGTPTAESAGAPFTVQASYKTRAGQRAYQVVVGAIAVQLGEDSLPGAKHATPYSFDLKTYLTVTGDAAYTAGAGVAWSLASGALPPGITLNPTTGVLSGTPTGSSSPAIFMVRADYKQKFGQRAYSLAVENVQLVLAADSWGPGGSPRAHYYADQTVASSCKAYRNGKPGYTPAAATGYYWVDMGAGVERVYCDMTTNGGGWTLVARSGGTNPAYAGCTVSAGVNTPFGWAVARGAPADMSNPYSMGVFNRNLAFTEVLFGGASGTSNTWGANVFQQWVPANFKTSWATNDVAVNVTRSFGMASRMGHTSDTTQYFFRDMPDGERAPGLGFGLHADGWLTCYGDGPNADPAQGAGAEHGGYINFRHGLLMVR